MEQTKGGLVGILEVVHQEEQPASDRREPHQLRDGHEQSLVTGLAGPDDVLTGEGALDLGVVVVLESVEERRVLPAQVGEGLEHGGVRPRPLDRGRRATAGAPALPASERFGEAEDGGLAHTGRS